MLFHIISIDPLSTELFPNDPLSRELYGDPALFPFFYFIFFSSDLGNTCMCSYFTTIIEGPYHRLCDAIRTLSPILGRLFKDRETCTFKSYPLFLNFLGSFWKTPHWFPFFLGVNLRPETNSKKTKTFPEKMGMRMQTPCTFECVGCCGFAHFQTNNVIFGEHIFQHGYQVTPSQPHYY